MMMRVMHVLLALMACALAAPVVVGSASGHPTSRAASASVLTAVRAAHHPGFDRVVFEFTGPGTAGAFFVSRSG